MRPWQKILVLPTVPIMEALRIIDENATGLVVVVDEERHLLGTVSDGDVRRGILRGFALNESVAKIMNLKPYFARRHDSRATILNLMREKQIRQIPILNENGQVLFVELLNDFIQTTKKDNWVVLMAGGLGTRLQPLTEDCPKPLLRVGDKPILETILESFRECGFQKFYLSVNYKAEMIEDYFGTGGKWGVQICYLKEDRKLGTAGALSLLPERPEEPFFVMNGDLLTKVNFEQLLDFHLHHQATATMCVRDYEYQVPYGVVELEQHRLKRIVEKPIQQYFVSAGIYVLNPETLNEIPKNQYFDMPTLFEKIMEQKRETIVFPIREYWLDIGRMADFEKANFDYVEVFK